MAPGAARLDLIDLEHQGRPDSIAVYLLSGKNELLVVDPGPASTLPRLRDELLARGHALEQLTGLLLTHIHLDHAGASGTLARANPDLRVYVHARGAPHLIDPTKLVNSARRLYGDRMDQLWGEIAPVPESQISILAGGETLPLLDRGIAVEYTPGHAWHHVSYFEPESGTAFVGDTAGVYGPKLPVVLPVTPPPDFDLEAWLQSIERILEWAPRRLALTHFGLSEEPRVHLEALRSGLVEWAGYAREAMGLEGSDQDRLRFFTDRLRAWIRPKIDRPEVDAYLAGAGVEACWQGLARYWRTVTNE